MVLVDSLVRHSILAVVIILFGFIAIAHSGPVFVGTASIRAPAVVLENNTGSLTTIKLTITAGSGIVSVIGPQTVANSTVQSAQTAATYASNYTGNKFADYNFTYEIEDAGDNVSGPSAGAAMAILAVSAFTNKPLRTDFTMTGTIMSNGSIGQIGGVYDKTSAAKSAGAKLILVPKVAPTDSEDQLYLLVQTNFGIPLVQVANISQAAYFAFNKNASGIANQTRYNFTKDYNIADLPDASINCTASCNYSTFDLLLNSTFNLTRGSIDLLASNPKFYNISMQLGEVLNQSVAVANHGYIYTGADFAFLDYVDAFYFNGYSTNRSSALALLYRIQGFCNSLNPPPLTESNYNYVISAELRQLWGNYTINSIVSGYNSSQIDSDQILDELYLGAEANGWCTAANLVYNESNANGTYVTPSPTQLSNIAAQRVGRALKYGPTIYSTTAQTAYKQGNYAAAILDSDYAFSLSNASSKFSLQTGKLDNISLALARNATYGVWATEFARETQFYASQSALTTNSTLAKDYAESAYSAALLASQISNDTSIIHNSLIEVAVPSTAGNSGAGGLAISQNSYIRVQNLVIYLLILIIALLLIIIALAVVLIITLSNTRRTNNKNKRPRKDKK